MLHPRGDSSIPIFREGAGGTVCGRFFFTLLWHGTILSPTRPPQSKSRKSNSLVNVEDDAMKGCLILLSLVLAGAVFAGMPASANQAAAENKAAPAAKKETKWQGNGARIYKDEAPQDILR